MQTHKKEILERVGCNSVVNKKTEETTSFYLRYEYTKVLSDLGYPSVFTVTTASSEFISIFDPSFTQIQQQQCQQEQQRRQQQLPQQQQQHAQVTVGMEIEWNQNILKRKGLIVRWNPSSSVDPRLAQIMPANELNKNKIEIESYEWVSSMINKMSLNPQADYFEENYYYYGVTRRTAKFKNLYCLLDVTPQKDAISKCYIVMN